MTITDERIDPNVKKYLSDKQIDLLISIKVLAEMSLDMKSPYFGKRLREVINEFNHLRDHPQVSGSVFDEIRKEIGA